MDSTQNEKHNHESSNEALTSENYRDIFSRVSEAIIIFDEGGRSVELNLRACEILGIASDRTAAVYLSDLLLATGSQEGVDRLTELRQKGELQAEGAVRRKNGKTVHLAIDLTTLREGQYIAVLRDITEQKKLGRSLKESEERHRSVFENSALPTAIFVRNKHLFSNPAFKRCFSWMEGRDATRVALTDLLGKKNVQFLRELRALSSEGQQPGTLKRDVAMADPDGTVREFEVSAVPVQIGGKPAVQCEFVDITEREKSLEHVHQSEAKYRQLVESAADAVSLAREGRFLLVNKSFLNMFGYGSPDDIVGKETSLIVGQRDRKAILSRGDGKGTAKGTSHRHEFQGLRRDGTTIEIEAHVSSFKLNDQPVELIYHRDITERKKVEAGLRDRLSALEAVQEILAPVNESIRRGDMLLVALQASLKSIGFDCGCAYRTSTDGSSFTMVYNHDLSENLTKVLSSQPLQEGITGYVVKTLEPLALHVDKYPPHLPHKSLFESEGMRTLVYIPLLVKDNVPAILMLATRKKRELLGYEQTLLVLLSTELGTALANTTSFGRIVDSEEHYRSAVEGISEIIYRTAASGVITFISPNISTLLGYPPGDFYRSPDLWRSLVHPDDRTLYSQRISNQSAGESFTVEYRILPKGKASYRWVRDSIRYKRDKQGVIQSATGLLSDITDRLHLQSALVRSEELKTNVLDSIQEGVVVYNSDLVCLDWNPAMYAITGIPRDEVVGRGLADVPAQIGIDELRPLVKQALQGRSVSSEDIPLPATGEIEPRYIWARYAPLFNKEQRIQGVVGIITDVTGRRRLEQEAKESEHILRNVIDGMGDALMICDLQGKVWEVNREFSRITGYQRSRVLGLDFPYPWLVEEEMAAFVKWIAALRERSELRDFDMTWKREDDHRIAMSLNTTLLRNALGEPVAMLNIGRDISDRKRLGLELEKKNSQIELLNRIISKANATIDFDEIFTFISSEVRKLVPYDQINVGLLSADGDSLVTYACHSPIERLTATGTVVPTESTVSKIAIKRKQGIIINHLSTYEELNSSTLSIAEGFESQISIPISVNERVLGTFNILSVKEDGFTEEELAYLLPIADQIGAMIDRSRLFQRVSDDSKYIHNLLNSVNSVVYTADTSHRITEVNKTWREFAARLGLEKYQEEDSLLGRLLWEIIPQSELRAALEKVMPRLFEGELDSFSQEYEIRWNGERRTYQLTVNPMVINEKVTGLVFSHTDITELKRKEAEIGRRNKELVALNAISTSISKSLHLDEVLRVAADQIKEIVGADLVLFYLIDERRNRLILEHSVGLPEVLASQVGVLPASSSVTGIVISERKSLLIQKGAASDERVTPEGRAVLRTLGIESLIALPLQSKDRVLGAMDVAFTARHNLDAQEQQLLLLIGNQIGPAIENAVLYKEVQEQVRRITSLYMIGKGLTGALDVRTLLEIVHAEVSRAIPVERFIYQSYSDQQNTLTTVFEATAANRRYLDTVGEGSPVVNANDSPYAGALLRGDPWIGVSTGDGAERKSLMAVPVRSKQKIIGVILLHHSVPDTYDDTHLRLLESIANLTEIALDKAMLYQDTINKSIEIQARNKELDDFTYVVSHDLKEPLISVEGYSKIMLKDYRDKIDEEGREYLGLVVQSSERMKNLIDDLLTLSRVGRTAEVMQSVAVGDTVAEILHDLQFTLREKNVKVEVDPGLPTVQFNPTQLSMVFRNLISNAMKFNDKPDPRIVIGVKESPDEFIFSVEDNGIGIEQQYFDRIFMIFQRLQRSEDYRGTGAGLTIVKKIVENHKGRVWIDSTPGRGTTVFFTVPKAAAM